MHSLNVTVADSEDGRASFIIDFTVSGSIDASWQTKTDMTDHGYLMYLEETLGEDGLAELLEYLAEAEADALEHANGHGHGGGEAGGHGEAEF